MAMVNVGMRVAVLALLAGCGGAGDVPSRTSAQAGSAPSAAADEAASPGGALYRRACLMCHGERGAGTALAPALNDRRRPVDEVVRVVEAGVPVEKEPYTPMPPRGDGTFTDQDVRTVADYVGTLAR
jgi:mono/diheme cytochrome c family protein